MVSGDDVLTIDIICKKLNHWYKKIKAKMKGDYSNQYKQRCHKCSKNSHKPGDYKCSKNKKEDEKDMKTEKMTTET